MFSTVLGWWLSQECKGVITTHKGAIFPKKRDNDLFEKPTSTKGHANLDYLFDHHKPDCYFGKPDKVFYPS